MDTRTLRGKLQEHFGFRKFRPGQVRAVEAAMQGRDTVVLMPTGSGKSLCYQLPAMELKGVTVVISPLIALAADQAAHLATHEIPAVVLNSSRRAVDIRLAHDAINDGTTEFVFTTPERMQATDLCELLRARGVDLLVIDEAHCVSQWGHDFRPDYLSLHWIRRQLGDPPILALTATATADMLDDIQYSLRLENPEVISTGFDRKNIHLSVRVCEDDNEKSNRLLELLHAGEGPAICYVATTKAAETLGDSLRGVGIQAATYHGRMRQLDRTAAQEAFMSNQVRVMVATNAFGLGIDKPDIRQVIHFHMPGSIESYYQEFGRSGRDGLPAHCTLLYSTEDRNLQRFFACGGVLNSTDLVNAHHAIVRACREADVEECPLKEIAAISPLGATKLKASLQLLASNGSVVPMGKSRWRLVEPEVDRRVMERLADQSRERHTQQELRLQQMIEFVETGGCRWRRILDYFGEIASEPLAGDAHEPTPGEPLSHERPANDCGHCDQCVTPAAVA